MLFVHTEAKDAGENFFKDGKYFEYTSNVWNRLKLLANSVQISVAQYNIKMLKSVASALYQHHSRCNHLLPNLYFLESFTLQFKENSMLKTYVFTKYDPFSLV